MGEEGLEWRLDQSEGQVHFRLRTRTKELAGQTVLYALHGGGDQTIRGTFELRPDQDGWIVAETAFSLAELPERLAGECQSIEVRVGANGAV